MRLTEIAQAKALHEQALFAKPHVVGVGSGFRTEGGRRTDELCLVALVDQKMPRAALPKDALVPEELNGVRTDVVQVGRLSALASRLERIRPAPGGVSVGHEKVTAGTLGCVVRDRMTSQRLILSNNHVLANCNDAAPGDPILQPGSVDGGENPDDVIARLERFIPLQFSDGPATCDLAMRYARLGNRIAKLLGAQHRLDASWHDTDATNEVDAATALPVDDADISEEILDIGILGGTTAPRLNMRVRKSGRTSGYSTGEIVVMDASVDIHYGDYIARFVSQLLTTPMSSPGDSGSVLVDGEALLAVGLLFAGSDQASVYNPVQPVLERLEVVI